MYQRILLPIDGSTCSDQAVNHGLALAKSIGAKVTFLHAYEDPFALWADPESIPYRYGLYQDHERLGRELLARAETTATDAGVESETLLVKNVHPIDAILEAEKEHDVIIMSSHGRRGFDRVIMGSVTEGVFRKAKGPNLVVHCSPAT